VSNNPLDTNRQYSHATPRPLLSSISLFFQQIVLI